MPRPPSAGVWARRRGAATGDRRVGLRAPRAARRRACRLEVAGQDGGRLGAQRVGEPAGLRRRAEHDDLGGRRAPCAPRRGGRARRRPPVGRRSPRGRARAARSAGRAARSCCRGERCRRPAPCSPPPSGSRGGAAVGDDDDAGHDGLLACRALFQVRVAGDRARLSTTDAPRPPRSRNAAARSVVALAAGLPLVHGEAGAELSLAFRTPSRFFSVASAGWARRRSVSRLRPSARFGPADHGSAVRRRSLLKGESLPGVGGLCPVPRRAGGQLDERPG